MKKIILSPWLSLITLCLVIGLRVIDPTFVDMLKKTSDNVDEGSIIINGVNILFVKKISEDKANMILIYCKENDENSSISFVSFYPSESENYYKPIIEKAFLSAKIKQ
jgi:hypothetical protein